MTELLIFLLAFAFLCIGMAAGCNTKELQYQKQAIELGFAHYNATNGVWQWNTNQVTR